MAKTRKEYVPREVIEDQLLAALDGKNKVAILLNEDDLDLLITALRNLSPFGSWGSARLQEFLDGLRMLRDSTFRKAAEKEP